MYRCAEATHKKTSNKLASMRLGSLNGVLIPALDFASAFVAYYRLVCVVNICTYASIFVAELTQFSFALRGTGAILRI